MGFDAAVRTETGHVRAELKCAVILRCAAAGEPKTAPKGDYLVSRLDDGALHLQPTDGGTAFRLSFDAAAQHVVEGRVALSGAIGRR